jgi:hypothetical protein
MTIAMLHAAEDVWLDRAPEPMPAERAKDNLNALLRTLDDSPTGGWTQEAVDRLCDGIVEVFDQHPVEADDLYRAWREQHPGSIQP